MGNHIQLTFTDLQPEQQEVLIAHLAEAGFEGFEETAHLLKAFIPEEKFDAVLLRELVFKYQLDYTQKRIKSQNWNALWEKNFQPVVIDNFVAIRANFHAPVKNVEYEIIITPKMSFGTGHHATTVMMIRQMREINFEEKTVFDFGTGTGVLAILGEKLMAIDSDEWSIANTKENIERNNCDKITVLKASSPAGKNKYDIILANINKNIILGHFPSLIHNLAPEGTLLLSGLLEKDEREILAVADKSRVMLTKRRVQDNWISLRFNR